MAMWGIVRTCSSSKRGIVQSAVKLSGKVEKLKSGKVSGKVRLAWLGGFALLGLAACSAPPAAVKSGPAWEVENPIQKPKPAPLGMEVFFEDMKTPDPPRVRLGRWLFYENGRSGG